MVTATLVDRAIGVGRDVLNALDTAQVEVDVALWLFDSDSETWLLALASAQLSALGPKQAYAAIQAVLATLKPRDVTLQDITVRSWDSPMIRALRTVAASGAKLEGTHIRASVLDRVYIENAFVYRVR